MRAAARSLALALLVAAVAVVAAARAVAQAPATQERPTLTLSGLLLFNGFYNSGKTNNSDMPGWADSLAPADASGLPLHNLAATIRQSRLTLTVSGMRARGARITGTLQADFNGGQQPSAGGRTYPLLRVRVATVTADWGRVSVLVGQEHLVIAPQNPVSFASYAAPLFLYSGNLWFRSPQVRVTAEPFAHRRVGFQAAALAPMQPAPQGAFLTQPDSAERSARPSLEGRVYLKWGHGALESELGVGGHVGWIATTGDSLLRSQVVVVDARVAVGAHLTLAGEAFSGEALGALGGAVGQNLGVAHVPVGSRGGWLQADVRPDATWEFGGGFGIDDPVDADLAAGGRERNVTWAGHLILHPGGGLLLGAEFRRIETRYAARTLGVTHLNAYTGLAF